MEEPKKREIKLEAYVVAYLGQYLTMLEKGVEVLANVEVDKVKSKTKN